MNRHVAKQIVCNGLIADHGSWCVKHQIALGRAMDTDPRCRYMGCGQCLPAYYRNKNQVDQYRSTLITRVSNLWLLEARP